MSFKLTECVTLAESNMYCKNQGQTKIRGSEAHISISFLSDLCQVTSHKKESEHVKVKCEQSVYSEAARCVDVERSISHHRYHE